MCNWTEKNTKPVIPRTKYLGAYSLNHQIKYHQNNILAEFKNAISCYNKFVAQKSILLDIKITLLKKVNLIATSDPCYHLLPLSLTSA